MALSSLLRIIVGISCDWLLLNNITAFINPADIYRKAARFRKTDGSDEQLISRILKDGRVESIVISE